jgi:hypothetical protein
VPINIREEKLLEMLEKELKKYEMQDNFKDFNKRLALKILEE